MTVDIIIVGGGPAGMTAAIYALRNNKSVLMLESTSVGGQIATSPKVENFPTYSSVSGAELADKMFEQILNLGANFELEQVQAIVKRDDGTFAVGTDGGEHYAKAVIIANGVKQKHIGVKNEEELLGKGVYYCAICDGAFYKNQEVAVIGDGNSALQSALMLSEICTKVYVLTLFDRYYGEEVLVDLLKKKENIVTIPNSQVTEFVGENQLSAVKAVANGKEFSVEVAACFVSIGQIPDNKAFENLVTLDNGYIVTDQNMATSTDGLFAAGDTTKKQIRQLTTAVSDGSIAAMSALDYIRKNF